MWNFSAYNKIFFFTVAFGILYSLKLAYPFEAKYNIGLKFDIWTQKTDVEVMIMDAELTKAMEAVIEFHKTGQVTFLPTPHAPQNASKDQKKNRLPASQSPSKTNRQKIHK